MDSHRSDGRRSRVHPQPRLPAMIFPAARLDPPSGPGRAPDRTPGGLKVGRHPMARLGDTTRQEVLRLAREGVGRNAIAAQTGVSLGSVTNICTAAGVSFDRAATAAATAGRKIDLAARRAQLESDYLHDAEQLRRQLFAPYDYAQPVGGQDPQVMRWTTTKPVPADQLKIMQASTLAVDRSQKIADAASDQGTEAAKSMLANLMSGLADAWHHTKEEEQ